MKLKLYHSVALLVLLLFLSLSIACGRNKVKYNQQEYEKKHEPVEKEMYHNNNNDGIVNVREQKTVVKEKIITAIQKIKCTYPSEEISIEY